MDFRRIPFQFSTTDPVKRQEELRKRFGLSAEKDKMHIDFSNSGSMGAKAEESNSATSSPRLQHRVPIFIEGSSEPVKSSVDNTQNIDSGRKPHVRVIPIEIETDASKHHRSLLGSSAFKNEPTKNIFIPEKSVKHHIADPLIKAPRVCNIPVKIEKTKDPKPKSSSPVKSPKSKTPEAPESTNVKLNGCSASKIAKVTEKKESPQQVTSKITEKKESPEQITLKKIENILEKLKSYHADVEKFSGTVKEKQYRYLDEMLTRCMLQLDEIDTMGLNSIRLSRKDAVKKVQASIDLLESNVVRESEVEAPELSMQVESSTDEVTVDIAKQEPENIDSTSVLNEVKLERETQALGEEMSETGSGDPEQEVQMDLGVENISITEAEDIDMSEKREVVQDEHESSKKVEDVPMVGDETVSNEQFETSDQTLQITEVDAQTESTSVMEAEPVIEEPVSESKEAKSIEADFDSCGDNTVDLNSENCSVVINEMSDEDNSTIDSNEQVGTNRASEANVEMDNSETVHIPVTVPLNQINGDGTSVEMSPASEVVTNLMDSKEMQPDHLITNSKVPVTSML